MRQPTRASERAKEWVKRFWKFIIYSRAMARMKSQIDSLCERQWNLVAVVFSLILAFCLTSPFFFCFSLARSYNICGARLSWIFHPRKRNRAHLSYMTRKRSHKLWSSDILRNIFTNHIPCNTLSADKLLFRANMREFAFPHTHTHTVDMKAHHSNRIFRNHIAAKVFRCLEWSIKLWVTSMKVFQWKKTEILGKSL